MLREEECARQLIELALPGARMVYSRQQSDGECDFTLVIGDERRPLEVTKSTSERLRVQRSRITKGDPSGRIVYRTRGDADWSIVPSLRADIREIRLHVDEHVAAVEAEGRSEFSVDDHDASPAARACWEHLSITSGFRLQNSRMGQILLELPDTGVVLLTPELVSVAVERECKKADNVRKLRKAGGSGGALFVYLDPWGYPADSAMTSGCLPDAFPQADPVIAEVWVASPTGVPGEHVLWHATRPSGWRDRGKYQLEVDAG